jgi:hypothetical protein
MKELVQPDSLQHVSNHGLDRMNDELSARLRESFVAGYEPTNPARINAISRIQVKDGLLRVGLKPQQFLQRLHVDFAGQRYHP